jgi:hypothetical protein
MSRTKGEEQRQREELWKEKAWLEEMRGGKAEEKEESKAFTHQPLSHHHVLTDHSLCSRHCAMEDKDVKLDAGGSQL